MQIAVLKLPLEPELMVSTQVPFGEEISAPGERQKEFI